MVIHTPFHGSQIAHAIMQIDDDTRGKTQVKQGNQGGEKFNHAYYKITTVSYGKQGVKKY